MESGTRSARKTFAGYTAGETPRRVFMHGREYPVDYIVYRYKGFDLEKEQYHNIMKVSLRNYGECNLTFWESLDKWEYEEPPQPERPFSEEDFD